LVEYAKQHNIKPMEFPFDLATQIFNETLNHKIELTISSDEFYSALNPLTMVENRITDGGSQRKEVLRMLNQAKIKNVENKTWLISKKGQIDTSLFNLDKNYDELLKKQ
jgi:argininosuccinate lyase